MTNSTMLAQDLTYQNWTLYWTGWKSRPDSDMFFSQWIAESNSHPYKLYASWPGSEGRFYMGQVFDTAMRLGQFEITQLTPADKSHAALEDARKRIFELIDKEESGSPNKEKSMEVSA